MDSTINMYQFTKQGTMGETLYDVLESIGMRNITTKSLVLNSLELLDKPEYSYKRNFVITTYEKMFKILIKNVQNSTTKREKEEILKKANSINPEKYQFDSYNDCIDFLNSNRDTVEDKSRDEYYELNNIILESALDELNDDVEVKRLAYLVYFSTSIEKKITEFDSNNKDIEKIKFAARTLSIKMKEYDEFLEKVRVAEKGVLKEVMAEISSKDEPEFSKSFKLKRDKFVDREIAKTIIIDEKNKYKDEIPEDAYWKYVEYKKPVVVCDNEVVYSEDEQVNQRIIAISYGKLNYASKKCNTALDLVGVHKEGKEDSQNYFVFMPSTLKEIGVRLPENMQDFYSKVMMSDRYLEGIVAKNFRCMGQASNVQGRIHLNPYSSFLGNINEFQACKYALRNPGVIVRQRENTRVEKNVTFVEELNSYIHSAFVFVNHLNIVSQIKLGKETEDYTKMVQEGEVR